jgi:hypothetical protein
MNSFKLLVIFSFLISSQSSLAEYSISAKWNSNKERVINLSCDFDSARICLRTCMDAFECTVPEGLCYNCIGNDLFIVNFYKNLGYTINSTGNALDNSVVTDLLRSRDFITLKSNSIYNIISNYDSKSMKKKFKNLCPNSADGVDPIVFVKVDRNRKPTEIAFTLCGSEAYEMTMDSSYYSTELSINNEIF